MEDFREATRSPRHDALASSAGRLEVEHLGVGPPLSSSSPPVGWVDREQRDISDVYALARISEKSRATSEEFTRERGRAEATGWRGRPKKKAEEDAEPPMLGSIHAGLPSTGVPGAEIFIGAAAGAASEVACTAAGGVVCETAPVGVSRRTVDGTTGCAAASSAANPPSTTSDRDLLAKLLLTAAGAAVEAEEKGGGPEGPEEVGIAGRPESGGMTGAERDAEFRREMEAVLCLSPVRSPSGAPSSSSCSSTVNSTDAEAFCVLPPSSLQLPRPAAAAVASEDRFGASTATIGAEHRSESWSQAQIRGGDEAVRHTQGQGVTGVVGAKRQTENKEGDIERMWRGELEAGLLDAWRRSSLTDAGPVVDSQGFLDLGALRDEGSAAFGEEVRSQ